MLFKDDSEPDDKPPSSEFFLQRLEVDAVPVRFDYKPKRIDYTGLRSGRTGELMNIVALDGADFVLKHLILYGVDGADQLHKMLNDIWMDDILTNQLPGVLAGLAPIRPFVNVGSGIRDLVVVPMREYRKDGRIVRSIQKGAVAFARTTASELARLGAKVAIGTQNVLQGTESLLSPGSSAQTMGFSSSSSRRRGIDEDWDDDFAAHSPGPEEKRVVSNYANQPLNVVTGVRAAYRGLERDLTTARDAIIAIGGEVRESESAQGVVGAVARHGATVILRPAIATTRAIGTALLGAGNMLDKDSKRKIEEVSFTIFLFQLPTLLCSSFANVGHTRNTKGIRPCSRFCMERCSLRRFRRDFQMTFEMHISDGWVIKLMKLQRFIAIVVRFQLRLHCLGLERHFPVHNSMTNKTVNT